MKYNGYRKQDKERQETYMKKKKMVHIAVAVCTGMLLSVTPVLAAADTAEYTVTLRPGSIAQFSDEFINAYVSTYGAEVTGKTGSIKVKLNPGESIPMLPDDGDLVYKDSAKGRYTMNTDWYPDTNVVTGNESFVVKYDALVNAVEYKVRYVDRQSGEDVAPPVITQGNAGQSYTYYSQQIADYVCDVQSQTLTLAESGDNVITFEYTSTKEPEVNRVEVPGDTIIQEERVPGTTTVIDQTTTAGTTTGGQAGATGDTAGDQTTGTTGDTAADNAAGNTTAGTETIEDEDVPLGQVDLDKEDTETANGAEDSENVEIEDEDVPLGQKDLEEDKNTLPLVAGGAVVIIAGAGAGLYFYRKRK